MSKQHYLLTTAISLVAFMLIAGALYMYEGISLRNKLNKTATALSTSVWVMYEETPKVILEDYVRNSGVRSAIIFNTDGEVFVRADSESNLGAADWPIIHRRIDIPIIYDYEDEQIEIGLLRIELNTRIYSSLLFLMVIQILLFVLVRLLKKLKSNNLALVSTNEDLRNSRNIMIELRTQAALDQMVMGVAHELNTPLGNITLSADLLKTALDENKREDIPVSLQVINDSTRDIVKIVRRMKLISSQYENTSDSFGFDMEDATRLIFMDIVTRHRCANAVFSWTGLSPFHVSRGFHTWCIISTELIENVIGHQTDNECDDPQVIFNASMRGSNAILEVTSPGTLIPPDIRDSLFDPFVQGERHRGSSGLGLHIVRKAVMTRLNGSIELLDPGPGTTFRIIIPGMDK